MGPLVGLLTFVGLVRHAALRMYVAGVSDSLDFACGLAYEMDQLLPKKSANRTCAFHQEHAYNYQRRLCMLKPSQFLTL